MTWNTAAIFGVSIVDRHVKANGTCFRIGNGRQIFNLAVGDLTFDFYGNGLALLQSPRVDRCDVKFDS